MRPAAEKPVAKWVIFRIQLSIRKGMLAPLSVPDLNINVFSFTFSTPDTILPGFRLPFRLAFDCYPYDFNFEVLMYLLIISKSAQRVVMV